MLGHRQSPSEVIIFQTSAGALLKEWLQSQRHLHIRKPFSLHITHTHTHTHTQTYTFLLDGNQIWL